MDAHWKQLAARSGERASESKEWLLVRQMLRSLSSRIVVEVDDSDVIGGDKKTSRTRCNSQDRSTNTYNCTSERKS